MFSVPALEVDSKEKFGSMVRISRHLRFSFITVEFCFLSLTASQPPHPTHTYKPIKKHRSETGHQELNFGVLCNGVLCQDEIWPLTEKAEVFGVCRDLGQILILPLLSYLISSKMDGVHHWQNEDYDTLPQSDFVKIKQGHKCKELEQGRHPIKVSCQVSLCQGTVRVRCLAETKWKIATPPYVSL